MFARESGRKAESEWEKQKNIHKHCPVDLGLFYGGDERGKWSEIYFMTALRTVKNSCIEYCEQRKEREKCVHRLPGRPMLHKSVDTAPEKQQDKHQKYQR